MLSREFAGGLISRPVKRWASTAVTAGLVVTLLGTAIAATPAHADSGTSSPAPAPVASRPDAVSAMMAAKKQGSRVEVLDDRTDSSQNFANPDGTFSYEAYAVPQWTRKNGTWTALDPTLAANASGGFSPALSQSPLLLSGGGTGPLASMTVNGGTFAVGWPTALPKPTVSGATATYANVLPSGVDLQVTATAAGGVEESLIVKNATAAADPGLATLVQAATTSTGGTVSADAGGNLTVKDAVGDTLVTSPAPVMWDSSTVAPPAPAPVPSAAVSGGANASGAAQVKVASFDETPATRSTAHSPGSRAHQARVKVTVGGHKLNLVPDHTLLTAKSTVYPVVIDPAYVPHPATGTTLDWDEVQQAYPTTSNYNAAPGSGLAVGYQGFSAPTGIERSYYALSIPSAIYGSTVLSATLNTTVTYAAASGSNSVTVDAYSTCAISATTTWNNQPCHDSRGDANYPNPNAAKTFTTSSQSPNLAVGFDVTSSMRLVAALQYHTWDFELANASETNDVDLLRFADNPTFTITYNNPPATPANLTVAGANTVGSALYTSSSTPTLSSSATDANGDTVQLSYQILAGSTVKASGTTGFVSSGSAVSWKPTTALADGAYSWQVRAYDGQAYSAWTTAQPFTIDSSTAPAPAVNCAGYPGGVWTPTVAGGTTCTLTDTAGDISGYGYTLDGGATTSVAGATPTISINPETGYHDLKVWAVTNAAKQGTAADYVFGVGSAGVTSPADQSATSTTLPLQATAPPGATTVTFKYRAGTTGAFTAIPAAAVTNNGSAVVWPLATTAGANDVTTPQLTWNLAQTVADDELLQVEAEFSAANGNLTDSPPVSVTLDRLGTGTDFGTTAAGPLSVGLQSGNASLTANDVSIASFGSGLGVTRTFNSLNPTATGIFGPGWTSTLPVTGTSDSWSQLTDAGSYAQLTAADGSVLTFATGATSGGVTSYTGQGPAATSGQTLTKTSTGFTLTDGDGNQVAFTAASGPNSGKYLPSTVTQPNGTGSTGYVYDAGSGDSSYGQLMLAVAPDANAPAGTASTTACPYPAAAATWGAGCRGLQFSYDPSGKLLTEVDFVTSDGTTLTRTAVADYSYDATGRLAAEWDPRISPALKTGYTYDETTTDADYGRLTQISPAQSTAGTLAPWTLAYNDTTGSTDYGKLTSVSRTHNAANGGGTATIQVAYSVPLTVAGGGPADMDPATTAGWGQNDAPTSAVAVFPADHAPGSGAITDWTYAQVLYYDSQGREVNEAVYNNGWDISTTEYDQHGNDIRELSPANRATALAAGATSATIAAQLDTRNLYSPDGTELLDTYGPAHQALAAGTLQTVRSHTHYVYDQGAPNNDQDANGNPYDLITTETQSASLGSSVPGSSDVATATTQYVYNNGSDNTGWTLRTALQTINDPGTGHLNITSTATYNENSSLYGGDPLQTSVSQPSDTAGTGAGTTDTVYYTAAGNSVDPACGNQPSWTDLVCETRPAAQPGTAALPGLAGTTHTYNAYLKPLTTTQTYTAADGSTATRTTTLSYDSADRQVGSSTTTSGSGMGAAVAPSQTVYDPGTGLASNIQSLAADGSVSANLYSTYNDFGQLASYTDATSRVTSYSYNLAGAVTDTNSSGDDTAFSYDGGNDHSGDLTGETDKDAGSFGASYDADGNMTGETYPGGTTATRGYDSTDTATSLSYANSNWAGSLADTVTTNAIGAWANRSTLAATQSYGYDGAGRITTVADSQSGQCTSRSYSYDADSDRTGLTTAGPAADGSCQTTTATTQNHTYDAADRDTDTGYTYDTQGDVTTTPSIDAGGAGNLTSTYFANGILASQAQAGTTTQYTLDPLADRAAGYTSTADGITYTNHYADDSDNPDLITDSAGGSSRNIQGPNHQLAATVTPTGVQLQLTDLHGDLMATVDTAGNSVTSTATYTEFGIQETGAASHYSWLAGDQRAQSGTAGVVLMGARAYNPNTGRFSQVDPVPGGSANAYDYAAQDPVNNTDVNGQWCIGPQILCHPFQWLKSHIEHYVSQLVHSFNSWSNFADTLDGIGGLLTNGLLDMVCKACGVAGYIMQGAAALIYAIHRQKSASFKTIASIIVSMLATAVVASLVSGEGAGVVERIAVRTSNAVARVAGYAFGKYLCGYSFGCS